MKEVEFQRNLIGLEDLLIGIGQVTQTRGTDEVPVTKINGANLPYDDVDSMADKVDDLQAQMDTLPQVVDQDGDLLTGLIDTSNVALDLAGRLWRKTISAVLAEVYYGTELLFQYNPTSGNLVLAPIVTGDMYKADNLSGLADIEIAKQNIGVEIGVDVQAFTDLLTALSALNATSGTIEKTGADTVGVYTVTTAAKALLDDVDAAAQRATLGLGTAAVLNTGLLNNNIVKLVADGLLPVLDGSNLTDVPLDTAALQTELASLIGFNNKYETPQQVFTTTSLLSFNHSLGGVPTKVILELICITVEGGYAVGDVIQPKITVSSSNGGFGVWWNATQVGVSVYYYSGTNPHITKTGGTFNITPSKWKLRLKAWA